MSEETKALVPIEEKQVDFYGDDITAALVETSDEGQSEIYVPLRPICDYLGLDWSAQYRRTRRHPVLAKTINSVAMTATGLPGVGKGQRELICIKLEHLPGWLFGIDPTRVKVELQDKILRYQEECFKVLWQAFQSDAFSMVERQAPAPNGTLVQIREMGLAIAQMAEQQMELERNVNLAHSRLDKAVIAFKNLDQRLSTVEKKLNPGTKITDEQAAEVSMAVKALAEYLKSKDASKNHYQAAFGELYRRFGVSSYKNIRADQFEAVIKFLEDWRSK